jgi:4-amino-4-deoxy-L-arabinose transferase-like glycosyltransferase
MRDGDDVDSMSSGQLQRGPGEDGQPLRADGASDELTAEIRGLREEIARLRTEVGKLNETLTTRETVQHEKQADRLVPGVIVSVQSAIDRSRARWRAYRERFQREWAPGGLRWDVLTVSVVLLLAGVLRFYHLTTIPLGFHGDEAAAGLEAHRIMLHGWVGVFSPASGGNPTGFYYLAVIPVWLFGNTIFAIRVLSATIDVLTVLCFYIALRRSFGWGTAVAGSALLAASGWHVQFARIAFMNILWPLTVMIGLIAVGEAVRSGSKLRWAAAGGGLALGIYAYNGHFLYLGVVALAMAWILLGWTAALAVGLIGLAYLAPSLLSIGLAVIGVAVMAINPATRRRERLLTALAFVAGFGFVIWPMARFILEDPDVYFGRGRGVTVFRTEQWTALTTHTEQLRFLGGRYVDFWDHLMLHPPLDGVAGNGSSGIVPITAVVLAGIGILFGIARRWQPLVLLGVLTVLLAPFAPIASADFAMRRAMIMAPFLAMFGGIAVAEVIRSTWNRRWVVRVAGAAVVLVLLANIGYRNVNDFFTNTARSQPMHWVMGPEMVETAEYVETLPDDAYVYLYSERWPFHYEIMQYFAPDAAGETRGAPYGPDTLDVDPQNGQSVFVLMGGYQGLLSEIQARYPGGSVVVGPALSYAPTNPTYIAYLLPAQP